MRAFLRGINVSGSKIIKMEELRKHFSAMNLQNVKTYIQSGNVLFDSDEKNLEKLKSQIESGLQNKLGYFVDVMIRSVDELRKIVKKNPFAEHAEDSNAKLYVGFLAARPKKTDVEILLSKQNEIESYSLSGNELYILIWKDKQKRPFSNNNVEKILKTSCTTRNWNTVYKMIKLGKES